MKDRNLTRTGLEVLALAWCVVLFCSCVSFDISDAPSEYVWPHNDPAANWCGPIGAFFAYYLMYYVGPGVFLLLIAVGGLLVVRLWHGSITQPVLRGLGLALLVASASSSWYLVWPMAQFWPYGGGGFAFGNGGVLGIGLGTFLRAHFAVLGTSIVVVGGWVVGAVLLADSMILALM